MTIFGYVLSDDVVEDAVIATLKKWIPTAMAEVERQRGLEAGFYRRPQSFEVRSDFDSFPEDQLPRIIVVSLGWAEDPRKTGDGKFEYFYQVGVACIASSTDELASRRYAYRLGASAQLALVQSQSLDQQIGGRVTGVLPIDRSRNGEIDMDADRTLWVHRQHYRVSVKDALSMWAGPSNPDPNADPPEPQDPHTDPWPDWPTTGPGQVTTSLTPIAPWEET